ncbi:MAG: hypothetical protein A2612_01515 [Candidatus Moranbacteria bacterium RIFOXYD1_FULL_44_12]|nr:MAG: hypothetical protein A2612_01515 [Candidatus Moranbacteria bacterium RIFOXYD1_FULL_44_12]OGK67157.1 MAG: hypothetical protein A2377_00785 [Candidatus Roizmanbacteria bacterium RIFOXYB1_FULL_41_27]
MDEIEDRALNQEAVADNSPAATPAEETNIAPEVEEQEVEREQASSSEAESETTESEGVKSRSAEGRIRKLVRERNKAREEANNLSGQLRQATDRYKFSPENLGGLPQQQYQAEPQIQAGQEYSVDEINQRLQRERQMGEQSAISRADNIVRIRMAQQENLNRINQEAQDSMTKYKALDPKSEQFDPDLSDVVTEAVKEIVKANPHTSVKTYVDKLMKPYLKSVDKAQADATETAARYVSEQANRPTPATSQGINNDKNLSLKEIEEKVGIVG